MNVPLLDRQTEEKVRSFTGVVLSGANDIGSTFVADIDANNVATLITNQHVVRAKDDDESLSVNLIDAATGEPFTVPVLETLSPDGSLDAAVLKVDLSNTNKRPGIAEFAQPVPGEAIYPVGKPNKLDEVTVQSYVTDVVLGGTTGKEGVDSAGNGYNIGYYDENDVISVQKGMSGGPSVNKDGHVIGINGQHAYPLWGEVPYADAATQAFTSSDNYNHNIGSEKTFGTVMEKLDNTNFSIHPANLYNEFPELESIIGLEVPVQAVTTQQDVQKPNLLKRVYDKVFGNNGGESQTADTSTGDGKEVFQQKQHTTKDLEDDLKEWTRISDDLGSHPVDKVKAELSALNNNISDALSNTNQPNLDEALLERYQREAILDGQGNIDVAAIKDIHNIDRANAQLSAIIPAVSNAILPDPPQAERTNKDSHFSFKNRIASHGYQGEDLVAYQQFFINEGLLEVDGADGVFGNKTENAVVAFEQAHGLDPTGDIGPLVTYQISTIIAQKEAGVISLQTIGGGEEYNLSQQQQESVVTHGSKNASPEYTPV